MASNENIKPELILNAQQFQEMLDKAECRLYRLDLNLRVHKLHQALYSRIGVK